MKLVLRFAAPLVIGFALLAGATAGTVTLTPPTAWPKTDVPADPSVTFGTLPNGMRYLIKHNTHPEHGVSFYLRVAAGSFDETTKEAGISHFVEHMIFRGTTHIPDGEVFKRLQQIGLRSGADANAFTGADATVYTFDFPANNQTTLDTALTLTRDIASEVLFDPKAVDSERQVVLAEFRLGDTPNLHMARASHAAMFGERLAEAYFPIGTQATITAATADDLKAYYRAHYRPERAVLIVIGDIDPKTIEAEIKARFADWNAAGTKPAAPTYTYPDPRQQAAVKLFVEAGAPAGVQLIWTSPYDATPETRARDERQTVREIALHVLNLRLHALATSADPPFLAAGGGVGNSYHTAFVASLGANVGSGDPKRALKALRQTLLTVLRDGVSQDEVDRAITQQRSNMAAQVTAAPSRHNNQLAGNFSGQIGANDVIDGPENWQPTFEAAVKGLTAARVTAVLKELYTGHEPLIFVTSPTPVQGGEAALTSAYAEAANLPAPVAETNAPVIWPYTDFGPAGTIATRETIADLGATVVNFGNGVRATLKPTKYQEGQVQILVRIGHGRHGLPKDKLLPRWAVAGVWGSGGVNRIATPDLPKALNGKQWGASPEFGEGAFQVTAQTRPADLETELQFIAAFVTDPAWRPEGMAQIKSASEAGLAQALTIPGSVHSMHFWGYAHNNDKRWAPLTLEEIKATDIEAVKALLTPDLTNGPMEIVIVGDIDVDATLAQLTRTFGALAKRKIDTKPLATHEEMPKGGAAPLVVHHKGTTQEAVAMLAWKTTGMFPDTQTPRTLRVLEAVMRTRLFDELRTKEGITYSPQTTSVNSWGTPGWGFLSVTATIPAAKLADFYAAAKKVAADLAVKELSADEFERARGPLVSEAEHAEQINGYWLHALAGAQVETRTLDLVRQHISGLKAVTAADLQKAAQAYLKDDRTFRLITVPEGFVVPAELP